MKNIQYYVEKYPELEVFADVLPKYITGVSKNYPTLDDFLDDIRGFIRNCKIFNIYIDKDLDDNVRKFIELVKPEPFILNGSCGIKFDGLEDIENKSIRKFIIADVIGVMCERLSCGIFIKTNKTAYIDYVLNGTLRKQFSELSLKDKELFNEFLNRYCRVESYESIPGLSDVYRHIITDSIRDYLEHCLDMNKAESTKIILLSQTIKEFDHNGYLALDCNGYIAEVDEWGILNLYLTPDNEIRGNELYEELLDKFPNLLVEKMNKYLKDVLFVLFYTISLQEYMNNIGTFTNIKFELDDRRIRLRRPGYDEFL